MSHFILARKWQYYISRNVPLWHDSLYLAFGTEGYKKYNLPPIIHFRIHRGDESDFYYLNDGQYSRHAYTEQLARNLGDVKYIKFLIKTYQLDCAALVRLSKTTKIEFKSLHDFFYFYGLCNCMLDVTSLSSKILTDKAINLLKNFPNAAEIMAYYGRPRRLSPLQKLERELIGAWKKDIDALGFARKLWKKYAWIPVNFVGEPWSREYFVEKINNRVQLAHPKKLKKPKGKISRGIKYILTSLGEIAHLNEFRKAAFSQASLNIRPLLDKLAKEHNLSGWKDTVYLTHDEIFDLIEGNDEYQKKIIARRKKSAYAVYNKTVDSYGILGTTTVKKFEKKFKPKSDGSVEVAGMTANKGKIIGLAKIISGPQDFHKFKTGDILIAKMTSVDFLPIMKKAGAFVTDEGGMACHATIVAREYDKPCIIGTALATSVFKDGDLVEVDVERGIVRRL